MDNLREGIYLQEKKGSVGTGVTSQGIVYKNYYAVRLTDTHAELFLLDDDLALTGLRERVNLAKLQKGYEYQPELQARFKALDANLGPRPKAPASSAPASKAAPQARPAPKPRVEAKEPAGWWDMTRMGAEKLVKKKE